MGFRGNNNYKVLESVPGMMCKDLKARPGALYYPDLIEMSEETRKSVDEHGVCFDVPENKWYMETTDKAMKAFKTTVKYCWDRADCIQDDQFLSRSRLFQITPQPSVDLYNYEKPVKYAYDTASDLVADFSTLNNQNLEFVFGISELQKVSDQHILFDRTEEVGECEYFKIQPDLKPRSIPLSDETHMKCPGDTEWVPYSSTTFDSSTCVSQKGTYCDKELNEKNLCEVLVSSNSFINLRIETPKKTVIVRTYAGISSVLGEIGGLVSLLMSIFGFVNGIITQFFFRSRVLNIFFPIFQSQKITQHSNLKEIKKRAGEFINERLDIHRLLHDLACVQILLDLVFDQNMRDLALISSLRQFMEKSNQENQKASSPNGLAKQ
jgi:hypothetical protein